MKILLTIAALVVSSMSMAEFHSSDYNWNNNAVETKQAVVVPVATQVAPVSRQALPPVVLLNKIFNKSAVKAAYKNSDNGVFGYNGYNFFDPRWAMQEMSNIIN